MKKNRKNGLLLRGSQRILTTQRLSGVLSLAFLLFAGASVGSPRTGYGNGNIFPTGFQKQITKSKTVQVLKEPEWGSFIASQQSKVVVKGMVTAKDGSPLPGVTVSIKGTTIGTVTDVNGEYQITVPKSTKELQFSFIGMKTMVVPLNGQSLVSVTLEEEAHGINEVVVVGYGQQKRETVTGAISSIRTKEIKQSPAANLAVTLAGRLPGLTTIQTSGQPGADVTSLYLRGQGTLNGQSPLILVDGVPRELTYIDPNEVESVSILKDASATAVFGVRGANGVILVTTKRGTDETPQISLSVEQGFQDFTRMPKSVHSWEYAELRNEARANDGLSPTYTQAQTDHFRKQDEPNIYPDNNWMNIISKNYTPQTRYNLNISGGGKRATYFVNAGYLDQGGQWKVNQSDYDPSTWLHRYNFRSNIDLKLNPTLTSFLNVGGYLEKANQSTYPSNIIMAATLVDPPVLPGPLTPDGRILTSETEVHPPYGMINRSGYQQETRSNVTASFGLEQKLDFITEGLSTKAMFSFDTRSVYDLTATQDHRNWVQYTTPGSDGKDSIYYRRRDNHEDTPLTLSTSNSFESYFNLQWFVNYNRTFNKVHDVTAMLLFQRDEKIEPADRLPYRMLGLSGRVTYGYNHKYFAEFNAGYNGSEQFAKGHRFGFFPSFSGSWIVSNEDFLKANNILTFLKLRASWGEVGNDQLGSQRFLYLDDIKINGGSYSSLGNGQSVSENYIGNEKLKWEVAKKINLGTEIGLVNDWKLSIDVFNEKRNNVLINRGMIPNILGMSGLPPLNMGRISNHGYEIELNYQHTFSQDFTMLANLNFNHARNKVLAVDEPRLSSDYAYRYRETGYSIGTVWGYETDGYWKSQQDIDDSGLKFTGRAPRPGDFKYKDLNHDGVIDVKDYAPMKNTAVPQYTYGASFSFNYKSVDLSFLIQGVTRASKYYSGEGIYEFTGGDGVYYSIDKSAWTPERAAKGEKITFPALSTSLSSSETYNDFFDENCAYWRLKNLEIGYTIPKSWSKKIGSSKIRFYANGLNLFTHDHMISKNFDPEVSGNLSYPMTRVFNVGVNVNF